jgi:hypothetical protein
MITNLLLRAAVISSVVWCTACERPAYVWIPLLAIAVFVFRGALTAEGDAERIDALGDQTYFLAYSATVSALLGLLWRIYREGEIPNDLRPVEIMGVIALLTTLIGLIGMVTLKEYAQKLTEEGRGTNVPSANSDVFDSRRVTPSQESINPNYEAMQEITSKATTVIADFVSQVEKLPVAVDEFVSAIHDSKRIARDFAEDIRELHSVLDEWEKLQERNLDDVGRADQEHVQ